MELFAESSASRDGRGSQNEAPNSPLKRAARQTQLYMQRVRRAQQFNRRPHIETRELTAEERRRMASAGVARRPPRIEEANDGEVVIAVQDISSGGMQHMQPEERSQPEPHPEYAQPEPHSESGACRVCDEETAEGAEEERVGRSAPQEAVEEAGASTEGDAARAAPATIGPRRIKSESTKTGSSTHGSAGHPLPSSLRRSSSHIGITPPSPTRGKPRAWAALPRRLELESLVAAQRWLGERIASYNLTHTYYCQICLFNYDTREGCAMACGHFFCVDCLSAYVTVKIQEGQVLGLRCPYVDDDVRGVHACMLPIHVDADVRDTCIHTHACMWTCTRAHVHACMHAYAYVCVHTCPPPMWMMTSETGGLAGPEPPEPCHSPPLCTHS